MTPRERLLAVYHGDTPDSVPALADLSYWYAGNGGGKFIPGKTDGANRDKVQALLQLHALTATAIHVNLGTFYRETYDGDIRVGSGIRGEQYFHRFDTSLGSLEEVRAWSDSSFSWPITQHMVRDAADLKIIRHVFQHAHYEADWNTFRATNEQIGQMGVALVQAPYTGLGFLISRYAGVEKTVELAVDEPEEFAETIRTINTAHERIFTQLADGPSEVLFVSDNLSSDVQSPPWFERFSAGYYKKMADIAHAVGKPLVVHIDGRLRGLLEALRACGVDAADAVTPAPWGDLTPRECRAAAGSKLVLSGGVPPDAFLPDVPLEVFDRRVEDWLALRHDSAALIIAPGDQLPPNGQIERVRRMAEMAMSATY